MWQSEALPADVRQKRINRNANARAEMTKLTADNVGQVKPGDVLTLFLEADKPFAQVKVVRVYHNAVDGLVKYAHETEFGIVAFGYPLSNLYV